MRDRKSPRSPWRRQSRHTTDENAGHRAIRNAAQLYAEYKETARGGLAVNIIEC